MGGNKCNTDNAQQQMPFLEWKNIHTEALHSCGLIWVIFSQLEPINIEHRWYLLRFPFRYSERWGGGRGQKNIFFTFFCMTQSTLQMCFWAHVFPTERINKAQRPKVPSQKQLGQGKSMRGKSTLITLFQHIRKRWFFSCTTILLGHPRQPGNQCSHSR